MKIFKSALIIGCMAFVLSAGISSAQVPEIQSAGEMETVAETATPSLESAYATEKGGMVDVVFVVQNGPQIVGDVTYMLDLSYRTPTMQTVLVERTTFDDVITLEALKRLTKKIPYVLPTTRSGEYMLTLVLKSVDGTVFDSKVIHTVTLTPASHQNIVVHPESCTLTVRGKEGITYAPHEVPSILPREVLVSTCSVQYASQGGIELHPKIQTYSSITPNNALSLQYASEKNVMTFGTLETKDITTEISTPSIPGTYTVFLSYGDAENAVSYTYTVAEAAPPIVVAPFTKEGTQSVPETPPAWLLAIVLILTLAVFVWYFMKHRANGETQEKKGTTLKTPIAILLFATAFFYGGASEVQAGSSTVVLVCRDVGDAFICSARPNYTVTVSTDKDAYTPGQTVNIDIFVKSMSAVLPDKYGSWFMPGVIMTMNSAGGNTSVAVPFISMSDDEMLAGKHYSASIKAPSAPGAFSINFRAEEQPYRVYADGTINLSVTPPVTCSFNGTVRWLDGATGPCTANANVTLNPGDTHPVTNVTPNYTGSATYRCESDGSWTRPTAICTANPPVVSGLCGAAETNYAYNVSSYSGALCAQGTPSPTSPTFPVQGGSSVWSCSGSGGGSPDSCTATRDNPPVTDICGPADTAGPFTSVPTSGLCTNGSLVWTDNAGSDGTYNWNCGTASCDAPRQADAQCSSYHMGTYDQSFNAQLCAVGTHGGADGWISGDSFDSNGIMTTAPNRNYYSVGTYAVCSGLNGGVTKGCRHHFEPFCGAANGGTYASQPTDPTSPVVVKQTLCFQGTPTWSDSVGGDGTFNWSCSNGAGPTKSCLANKSGPGNTPPTADAGIDRSTSVGGSVTVSGASVSDAEDAPATLTKLWSQIGNTPSAASITSGGSLTPTFSGLSAVGTYKFKLTATDSGNLPSDGTDYGTQSDAVMYVMVTQPCPGCGDGSSDDVDIDATNCKIQLNQNTCMNSVTWDWIVGQVTTPLIYQGSTVFAGAGEMPSKSKAGTLFYGSHTFSFRDGASSILESVIANASCDVGLTWVAPSNRCELSGGATPGINAPDCTIVAGQNSCNSTVSWEATSVPSPSIRQNGTQFSTAGVSAGTVRTLSYGTHTFTIMDGGTERALDTAVASCPASAPWNGSICDGVLPPAPTLSLTAAPSSIIAGNSSTLTWVVTGATSCFASGGWSGWKAHTGTNNEAVSPSVTTSYDLECWNSGVSSGKRSVVVTVTGGGLECAGQTIAHCDLPPTPDKGTAGSCSIGYGGGCSYTCNGTVWGVPSSNTCSLTPTGDIRANGKNSEMVTSGEKVRLTWNTENTNACEVTSLQTSERWTGKVNSTGVMTSAIASERMYVLSCDGGLVDSVRITVSGTGGGGDPQCSDGIDNGDSEDTLADALDPGCHTDDDLAKPYNRNDDNETNGGGTSQSQCSDGIDNNDPEDALIDQADPGCHTDGNPNNPGSYTPSDSDEVDGGGGAGPSLTTRTPVVRQGERATLDWNTRAANEGTCNLVGGTLKTTHSPIPPSGSPTTGSVETQIIGRSVFTLTCNGLSSSVTVEMIPQEKET